MGLRHNMIKAISLPFCGQLDIRCECMTAWCANLTITPNYPARLYNGYREQLCSPVVCLFSLYLNKNHQILRSVMNCQCYFLPDWQHKLCKLYILCSQLIDLPTDKVQMAPVEPHMLSQQWGWILVVDIHTLSRVQCQLTMMLFSKAHIHSSSEVWEAQIHTTWRCVWLREI